MQEIVANVFSNNDMNELSETMKMKCTFGQRTVLPYLEAYNALIIL